MFYLVWSRAEGSLTNGICSVETRLISTERVYIKSSEDEVKKLRVLIVVTEA